MTEELNDNRHFYLYAKGWYVRDEDVLSDLKKIQSDYCGVEYTLIPNDVILEKMIELAYDSCSNRQQHLNLIWKIAHGGGDIRDALRVCLSVLVLTSKSVFGELGSPDPDILELN